MTCMIPFLWTIEKFKYHYFMVGIGWYHMGWQHMGKQIQTLTLKEKYHPWPAQNTKPRATNDPLSSQHSNSCNVLMPQSTSDLNRMRAWNSRLDYHQLNSKNSSTCIWTDMNVNIMLTYTIDNMHSHI